MPQGISEETIGTIWDRIESRRVAEGLIQRMASIWTDDRVVVVPHNRPNTGEEAVVAMGPLMRMPSTKDVVSRHGSLDAGRETVVAYGPCIPF